MRTHSPRKREASSSGKTADSKPANGSSILSASAMTVKDDAKRAYYRKYLIRRRELFFADKQCEKCGSTKEWVLTSSLSLGKRKPPAYLLSKKKQAARIKESGGHILCKDCRYTKGVRLLGMRAYNSQRKRLWRAKKKQQLEDRLWAEVKKQGMTFIKLP